MSWLVALGVFAAAFVTDIVWARYTLEVGAHRAVHAGLWAAGIVVCTLISVEAYIASPWYVVPTAAGAALGTYATVRHAARVKR